jgi:PRC-barrel domain protein
MKRFERLSRLSGYKVDKHQIDPRGWDVVNTDGRSIGEVKDLIVDMGTMKATSLDVELDPKRFDLRQEDPHVLIPVERADRDGRRKRLVVTGVDSTRVQELLVDRERAYYEFWNTWWQRDQAAPGAACAWSPTISQQVTAEQLRQALDNVKQGEQVRIPVVNEEIIVERRPLLLPPASPPDVLVVPDERIAVMQEEVR